MTECLIACDLPLAGISKASACERNFRRGHPSTLHIWWARRPLAHLIVPTMRAFHDHCLPSAAGMAISSGGLISQRLGHLCPV